jgi:fructose-1-phosphate kinase PfkB-like protein
MRLCSDAGAKLVLDANGQLLKEGVQLSPYLIKPNAEELAELTGLPTDTEAAVIAALKAAEAYQIPIIAVSLGGAGSIVRWENTLYRVWPAKVGVQNTVGCGDAYLAGLVFGLDGRRSPQDCLRLAAACGSAEAENLLTVGLNADRVQALASQIRITELED